MEKVIKICEICNKEFEYIIDKSNRRSDKFCSISCGKRKAALARHKTHNQSGINNTNWKGGVMHDRYRYKKMDKLKNPEKVSAREKVRKALVSGKLIKQNCSICNDINSEAHHEDYSKPLDVMWLCKKHHYEIHKNKKI